MFDNGKPNVVQMKQKRNINGLISALGYAKDQRVRWSAADALGEIGDARAVKPLIAVLEHAELVIK